MSLPIRRLGRRPAGAVLLVLACVACAAKGARPPGAPSDNYLRYVSFRLVNENVVLRWKRAQMPLRVHLPRPPAGLFDDPGAIFEVVRDGVVDWSGVAEPGVPSFTFVDDPRDADIPFHWEERPTGDWYVAYCRYDVAPRMRRFGVAGVLVTARYRDGTPASLDDLYLVVLHEMGHALGLGGHSPEPEDVMYAGRSPEQRGLSVRDRNTLRALYRRPIGDRLVGARRD